jgi:hypothetical protein
MTLQQCDGLSLALVVRNSFRPVDRGEGPGGADCSKDFFAMATKKLPWCRCTRRATAFWLSALALVSRTSCTAATKCGTL